MSRPKGELFYEWDQKISELFFRICWTPTAVTLCVLFPNLFHRVIGPLQYGPYAVDRQLYGRDCLIPYYSILPGAFMSHKIDLCAVSLMGTVLLAFVCNKH